MMMFCEIDRDQYAVPMSTALVDQNPPPRGPMDTKKNIEQTILRRFYTGTHKRGSKFSPKAPRYIKAGSSSIR